MPKLIGTIGLAMAAVFLTGCATIASGTTQKVSVSSTPTGAMAKVDGTMAALTPTIFTLERKSDHTLEIYKEGYRTKTVLLRRALNGMTAGNILLGGIIGTGIDAMNGSMYKIVPERVDVTLEKETIAEAMKSVPPGEDRLESPPAVMMRSASGGKGNAQQKLYALDQLLRDNRISQDEYEARKSQLLGG